MNILQINSYFAGSPFYEDLYNEIAELGIKQTVYVFTHKGNVLDQTYDDKVLLRRPYRYADRFVFPRKHRLVYDDLTENVDVSSFDLAHAHSLFSNGRIAMELKRQYGIPYVATVRNSDVNVFFKYALHLRKTGIEILKEAAQLIFLSKSHRDEVFNQYIPEELKEEFLQKTHLIPNGVNDFWKKNRFNGKTAQVHEPLRLLFVGNIDRNKNLLTSVKACEKLIQRGREVTYTVIGKVKVKAIKDVLDQKGFVTYHPFTKDRRELIEVYRNHDVYVMPSKTETFGISYVEAMSQGLPVIYTKKQGFDSHFDDGDVGYAVTWDQPEEIVQAILAILEDYPGFMRRALEGVDIFDWPKIAVRMANVYESVREMHQ